jgi:hypothetical protein
MRVCLHDSSIARMLTHLSLLSLTHSRVQALGVELLKTHGVSVTARSYRMAHSALPQEISDIADFMASVMAAHKD